MLIQDPVEMCEKPMLIWYLFNKHIWLGYYYAGEFYNLGIWFKKKRNKNLLFLGNNVFASSIFLGIIHWVDT